MRGQPKDMARNAAPKTKPTSTPTKLYPAKAADRLLAIAQELRRMQMPKAEVLPPTSIRTVASVGWGGKELYDNNWPNGCAGIYRITTDAHTAQQLWESAQAESSQRQKEAAEHKKAHPNKKHPKTKIKYSYQMARLIGWQKGKTCLYVGKAENLTPRLRQHLGPLSTDTYAMHLSMWAPEVLWDAPIHIEYWSLAELQLSKPAVQALEDYIWEESAPIFGKQGPK
jgi:hypothetical protein